LPQIGQQLARLRRERGWSQSSLARRAGVSSSAIAMYETERRTPDDSMVQQLATALEVPVTQLGDSQQPLQSPCPADKAPTGQPTDRDLSPTLDPGHKVRDVATAYPEPGLVTLAVSQFEARVLLAMRMNGQVRDFLHTYVTATAEQRQRMERTWELIESFQPRADT